MMKKEKDSVIKLTAKSIWKAGAIALLLFLMCYLCMHFKEYQKNATNQVNKYRIDQLCLMTDGTVLEQHFKAKHTHLKTLKLYSSNDYGGEASGTLNVAILREDNRLKVCTLEVAIKDLVNNGYTELDTDVQLDKGERYIISISAKGAKSGREPIFYQWSTKESGFKGKVSVNNQKYKRYLVAKLYYPVTIYSKWIAICLLIGCLMMLVLFAIPLEEKYLTILGKALFYLAPIFTFWMVERFTDNLIQKMRPGEFLLNIVLYYIFFGLFYLILYSRRLAVTVGMVAWILVGIANYYVLNFKGAPIVPSDFMSAETGFSVAANYTYAIQPVFVWNILFAMLYLAILYRCPVKKHDGWKVRSVMLASMVAVSCILGYFVIEQNTLKSVGIKNNVWDQKKGYAKNGLFFGFVLNMNSLIQEKPADYSVAAAQTLAERYEEQFANEDKGKGRLETKNGEKPNVILIMNEAFSDLSVVNPFETNEDYMPFIRSMKKNTIKGNLYMSIFGSGTCNSEFEVLTGNTIGFLQNGIIAYTQVVGDTLPNITYLLKEQGYGGNLALHPYLASGWNRPAVYQWMGFEHFYSQDDFVNPLMYRKYISDQSDFEKIVELYENYEKDETQKDQPFYLFNVTMQNHGGFDKIYDNFPHDVVITDNHAAETANQYLSLIKKTDEAFEYLIHYFEKVKEPTLVVMFGDHQPSVGADFYDGLFGKSSGDLSAEELMKKYETPFIIWANYNIEEGEIDAMSANYLGAYVMQQAGLKMSPYQTFLMKLYDKLPVLNAMGAMDAEGNYYPSGLDSPYKELVEEYQILQYNNLIDTKNTVESFFYTQNGKK